MKERYAVFVTGVSRGLGFELFDRLIGVGACPIGIGRKFAKQHRDSAGIGNCTLVTCDLSDITALRQIDLDSAIPSAVELIIFISNAAVVAPIGTIGTLDAAGLAQSLAVNVVAPAVLAGKLVVAADARHASLKVLNISSGAAKHSLAGLAAYCAGKGAVLMLFDCLARERPDVSIQHVDPGVIDTNMQAELRSVDDAALPTRGDFIRFQTERRLRPAREVAQEILTQAGLI